jgi:hypothetical protein
MIENPCLKCREPPVLPQKQICSDVIEVYQVAEQGGGITCPLSYKVMMTTSKD